jgi:predicted dehydrogenase
MINVGVIGPSRRHSGTGRYVAQLLHEAGATVAAVCASTPDSGDSAARELSAAFGQSVASFPTIEALIASRSVAAVAICTPAETHERQLALAVDAGLHTFCEKPLIWTTDPDLAERAAAIVRAFDERRVVLHHSAQWPFLLDDIEALAGAPAVRDLRSFEMMMAPPVPGLSMFWEAAPHPVSLLVALGGSHPVTDTSASFTADRQGLEIGFRAERHHAHPMQVRMVFRAKAEQPRPASMTFDGVRIDREVLSMSPYEIALRSNDRLRPIDDPLRLSVRHFVARLRGAGDNESERIVEQFTILAALWPAVREAHERAGAGQADAPHGN